MIDKRRNKGAGSKAMRELAPYMNLGINLAVTIGLFCLLGWWLDGKFGTKPLLIIICAFAGIAFGMYNFFRTISDLDKKKKRGAGNKPK